VRTAHIQGCGGGRVAPRATAVAGRSQQGHRRGVFVATDHLHALVQEAFEHALPSAGDGFIIFAMTLGADGRQLVRFVGAGLDAARKHVTANRTTIERYAIACDAAFTLDGKRSDAILIEAGERGNRNAARYGFVYRPGEGDLGPVAQGERLLLEVVANPLINIESKVVQCQKCRTNNRVALARLLTARARCGSCKQPLVVEE
jgi:hypothetical protein